MANMILFGAGASFGSDESDCVPALGNSLFDALRAFNPKGWGAVPSLYTGNFRTDFEAGMRWFSQSPLAIHTDVLQRGMAAYFFQFRPRPTNLYVELAERICKTGWKGALASLNYERLLELSLLGAGVAPQVRGLRDSGGEIELVLPHGCCHIFVNVQVLEGIRVASPAIKVDSPEPPKAIHDQAGFQRRIACDQLPPVMCYFDPQKGVRSGPSFIKGQRERLAILVARAEVIGVVGLRVRRHDTHIWGPLSKTDGKIVYCAGHCSGNEFRAWSEGVNRKRDEVLPTHWAEGFDTLCSAVRL